MTQIWGHRGASAWAPENTLPAFELALEQGADGFELDVQLSSDGEAVVIHDETLERTTNGRGRVADHPLALLRTLDASAGQADYAGTRIPTLGEVFALVKGTSAHVNVELKNNRVRYRGLEARVLDLADEYDVTGQVVWSSFNHPSLRRLRRLLRRRERELHLDQHRRGHAAEALGVLYSDILYQPWHYAALLGASALHPPLPLVDRRLVERCRAAGLAVHVWTVDDPADVRRLAALGVEAIITNDPALARKVLG